MKATRLYSQTRVFSLFREACVHGNYATLLKREGLAPMRRIGGMAYYNADQIDELIRCINA